MPAAYYAGEAWKLAATSSCGFAASPGPEKSKKHRSPASSGQSCPFVARCAFRNRPQPRCFRKTGSRWPGTARGRTKGQSPPDEQRVRGGSKRTLLAALPERPPPPPRRVAPLQGQREPDELAPEAHLEVVESPPSRGRAILGVLSDPLATGDGSSSGMPRMSNRVQPRARATRIACTRIAGRSYMLALPLKLRRLSPGPAWGRLRTGGGASFRQ